MSFSQYFAQTFLVLAALFGAAAALWGGYYILVALMSWRKVRTYPEHAPKHRFAVLIAARNEEAVIGSLVGSLLEQEYPRELYDVIVLPNNCTDNTAQAARQAGARVMECTVPVKSKGEVLRFAISRLLEEPFDAFCVFDADNIVDGRFLAEMNNALCAGVRAGQGHRDSKNPCDTALSGCCSIYLWMMDRFYNQGKMGCGLSTMVSGTGFMISRPVLERLGGWNTGTISEDLEMTVQCVLREEKVAWVPKAITYDEQPLTLSESVKQRKRWVSGTFQVAQQYFPQVWDRMRRAPGKDVADQIFTFSIPVHQVVALLSMVLSSIAAGFAGGMGRFALAGCVAALAMNLLVTAAIAAVTALITTKLEGKPVGKMWKGILFYGVFILSWQPITVLCMFRRTTEWEQIKHTRNVAVLPARRAVQKTA